MKKDIEWLRNEVNELPIRFVGFSMLKQREEFTVSKDDVLELINQLDEPEVTLDKAFEKVAESYSMTKEEVWRQLERFETRTGVLSQEGISENSIDTHVDTVNGEIQVTFILDDLQNLLVPKQELPVIPQFVANVIEAYKSNSRLTNLLADLMFHGRLAEFVEHEDEDEMFEWARSNYRKATDEILARAWLDGYTVEEEQKYNVKLKVKSSLGTVGMFLYKEGDEVLAGNNFRVYYPKEEEYMLTEQEIRGFQNGDVLFEHFAKPVEELEE